MALSIIILQKSHLMSPCFSLRTCISALALLGAVIFSPLPMAASNQAAEYYEDAVVRYSQGDYKAAAIQLKNALQRDPDMLQARLLLGLVHVREGNGAAAEEELLKANQLGADRSLTIVALAQAYLEQMRYRDLLTNIQSDGYKPPVQAEVLVQRGHAYLELGEFDHAAKSFAEAEQLNPTAASPVVGRATLLLRQGRLVEAETLANQAVSRAPEEADAWNVKASVSHAKGLPEQAIEEYGRVLDLRPEYYVARLARASLLLESNRNEAALADLEILRKAVPYEPRASFLYSDVMARRGAPEASRTALADAVTIIDAMKPEVLNDNPQILLVGGLANYRLKQPEKARDFLTRYVEKYPHHLQPRELLASLYLENKEVDQAIALLKSTLEWAPDEPALLALLGTAYMQKGWHDQAAEMLDKAVKLSGGAADLRTRLAFSRLGANQQVEAMNELYSVFNQDISQTPAAVALTILHMKRNEYAKAVSVAKKLTAAQPKNPTFLNLLASAQMGTGDFKSARISFEKARAEDAQFLPARINLGKLSLLEGQPDEAEAAFVAILREKPEHVQTMIELGRLEDQRGQPDKAIFWLEKARAADSKSIEARILLTRLYLRAAKPAMALNPIQEAEVKAPNNLEVLAMHSECQIALGKNKIAQVILQKMARLAGFDANWLLRIAELQLAADGKRDAIWSLESAVQGNPDSLTVREALTESLLLAGQEDKAQEAADALLSKFPDSPVAHGVFGDVRMQQGRYRDAAASYRKAMERQPSTQAAIRLYQAQTAAGDQKAALQGLQAWVKSHPDDLTATQALAEGHLALGELQEARDQYERVLQKRPNDAAVLNNLAYLHSRTGDSRALEYARRAHELTPDDPTVNDTLGWIIVQQGSPIEGLNFLRSAESRASDNPEIRYHVGAALERLGRRDEAVKELDTALKSGQAFEGAQDARALREKLAP